MKKQTQKNMSQIKTDKLMETSYYYGFNSGIAVTLFIGIVVIGVFLFVRWATKQ